MKKLFLFAVITSVLGWSVGSFAYIPPSQFILKTWANKHSGVKGIKIKTLVTAYDGNKPTDIHFKEVSVYSPETQVLKSWATDESEKKLYYSEKKIDTWSPISKLLISHDWHQLSLNLRERGIPVKTEQELLALRTESDRMKLENLALQRWNGGFAWVIGSTPSKEGNSPQIWFEKDTFLPLRMVYSRQDSDLAEVRFENYRFFREFPYPRTSSVLRKGSTYFTSQLIELIVDGEKLLPGGATPGFTEAGNSISSGMRELIRAYYEQFR